MEIGFHARYPGSLLLIPRGYTWGWAAGGEQRMQGACRRCGGRSGCPLDSPVCRGGGGQH